ncbi:MAG TPA: hypothetical protein VK487_02765 [Candidatus Bathyarchaeia archaeon]|nr:hypothetical protein [Candidatus Bathyarchaeia archaeon]
MPVGKYRGMSFPRELVDKIEEYLKVHPEMGYTSLTDFATDAIRERCRELRILVPEPARDLPSIEHFNIDENGVRILDRTIANGGSNGRIIDVYFKQDRVWCDYCQSEDCRHVKFALTIPKVQETLRQKGWKLNRQK